MFGHFLFVPLTHFLNLRFSSFYDHFLEMHLANGYSISTGNKKIVKSEWVERLYCRKKTRRLLSLKQEQHVTFGKQGGFLMCFLYFPWNCIVVSISRIRIMYKNLVCILSTPRTTHSKEESYAGIINSHIDEKFTEAYNQGNMPFLEVNLITKK